MNDVQSTRMFVDTEYFSHFLDGFICIFEGGSSNLSFVLQLLINTVNVHYSWTLQHFCPSAEIKTNKNYTLHNFVQTIFVGNFVLSLCSEYERTLEQEKCNKFNNSIILDFCSNRQKEKNHSSVQMVLLPSECKHPASFYFRQYFNLLLPSAGAALELEPYVHIAIIHLSSFLPNDHKYICIKEIEKMPRATLWPNTIRSFIRTMKAEKSAPFPVSSEKERSKKKIEEKTSAHYETQNKWNTIAKWANGCTQRGANMGWMTAGHRGHALRSCADNSKRLYMRQNLVEFHLKNKPIFSFATFWIGDWVDFKASCNTNFTGTYFIGIVPAECMHVNE